VIVVRVYGPGQDHRRAKRHTLPVRALRVAGSVRSVLFWLA
jgi:hypothetical protein